MKTQLTEDDIRGLLARAEEIHLGATTGEDKDDVIIAAEEAGLPREALEQALREQFELFTETPKPGDLVFAKSIDEYHYVAEVIAAKEDGVQVRFLKGSESTVPLQHLRPCGLLPGEVLSVHWPFWGWWTVTVVSHDEQTRRVRVDDGWGTVAWFSLTDVRLDPPKPKNKRTAMVWNYAALIATGGATGALITWLLMH